MASVLVVAVDPSIEALVGELVAFAGHRPLLDATLGVAGESIRRLRPEICLLDTQLPRTVFDHCLGASDEVGAQPILISSAAMGDELAANAGALHCLYFDLPGGPIVLGEVIGRAMTTERFAIGVPQPPLNCANGTSPLHPALCAALANVARARALVRRAQNAITTNRGLRDHLASELDETRRSRDALRAAVGDYARHLKAKGVAADSMVDLVATALSDCAAVVGAEEAAALIQADSRRWALAVYAAA